MQYPLVLVFVLLTFGAIYYFALTGAAILIGGFVNAVIAHAKNRQTTG